jgi:hypothetical protein
MIANKKNLLMKKILTFVFIVIIAASCCNKQQSNKPIDVAAEKEKVALVLEKYVIANEKQDITMIHNVWAAEPDIVVIGTNSDEMLIGWDAIKDVMERQFSSFEDTYISVHDQIININDTGNTAWFSEILNYNYIYQGTALQYEGLRFTGVLQKRDGEWLIVQSHMSIPATPN